MLTHKQRIIKKILFWIALSEQCVIVVSKGNQGVELIRTNITCKVKKLIRPLHVHLEYCIQFNDTNMEALS